MNITIVLIVDNSLYVGHDPSSTDSTAQYNIALGVTALDLLSPIIRGVLVSTSALLDVEVDPGGENIVGKIISGLSLSLFVVVAGLVEGEFSMIEWGGFGRVGFIILSLISLCFAFNVISIENQF